MLALVSSHSGITPNQDTPDRAPDLTPCLTPRLTPEFDPDRDPQGPGAAGVGRSAHVREGDHGPCAADRLALRVIDGASGRMRQVQVSGRHRFATPEPAAKVEVVGSGRRQLLDRQAGMTTAEYAVGTVAACGFAAVLWTVLRSGVVDNALTQLVVHALHLL